MKMIAFFLKYSRTAVLFSVAAGICSGACNAALLALINLAVKRNGPSTVLVWSFVGLCVLLPVTRFGSECLLTKLGQQAMYNLRMQLCAQILGAPLRHLEQIGVSRLLSALTDDIPTITEAILMVPLLCVNASLVIGCLVYMGILSPILLAMVLGFMLLGIASYQLAIIKVQRIFRLAREQANTLQEHFRALTYGTKELKINLKRKRAFFSQELNQTAETILRYNTRGQNLYSAAASWGQTLVFIVVGIILFVLPSVRHLTGNMMMAYTLTLLYLMTPLQMILNTLPQVGRANVALQNTSDLGFSLASSPEEQTSELAAEPANWQRLELKGITHTYKREDEGEDFVLGPIDISVTPGEILFIVGANGSGKTTLLKLLAGLYVPARGYVSVDGVEIADANRESYRQHFSAVFSDFYLFENMLGLDAGADEVARDYLIRLNLAHKVSITNGKMSTTELSQGQRKRLALLTSYLEDRSIYLFDEWAADQDPQFKGVFYLQLLPELKKRGKTVIVITHDDRYYGAADRIVKLDEGQIVSDSKVAPEFAAVGSQN